MKRPKATDIQIDLKTYPIPEGKLFDVCENVFGITEKHWICGTSYCDAIQLIGVFEILDSGECNSDEEDEDYSFIIQSSLIVHPKFFSQEYIKNFFEDEFLIDGKYPVTSALMDAQLYGGGFPINMESVSSGKKCNIESKLITTQYGTYRYFKTYRDAKKYIDEVYSSNISAVMGLIGFYLDAPANRIGTTGWDYIYHMTEGRDLFQPAWNRLKEQQSG
jgi:hypothetical protein